MNTRATRALAGWTAFSLAGAAAADGGPFALAVVCLVAAGGFAALFLAAMKPDDEEDE